MHRKVKSYTTILITLAGAALSGCSSTPVRPEGHPIVFAQPAAVVQKAAADALVVKGFDITKTQPLYVEGYRPRRIGLLVGSGGETVGVWLEPVEGHRTRVQVDTARTFAGGAGQRNWDDAVLEEMERSLGKREESQGEAPD